MSDVLDRHGSSSAQTAAPAGLLAIPGVTTETLRVAVLIPCRNEEPSIAQVVMDFRRSLPHAAIYVYDNNSHDRTALEARAAGAIVRSEPLPGKGNVVRRMFADIEAEAFVLVDGDGTYDAAAAPAMLRLLQDRQLDMVSAARVSTQQRVWRPGHRLGNVTLTRMVRALFGRGFSDVLSGYRVFSRRFVKSFPALAGGFETETEFTVHALELRMPIAEVSAIYRERSEGSYSKLNTVSDGLRILRTVLLLLKEERPVQFFGLLGLAFLVAGVGFGLPVVTEFLHTGVVPRLPTAVLATGLVTLGFMAFGCGLVLDSVARGRKEIKRLAYLAMQPVPGRA